MGSSSKVVEWATADSKPVVTTQTKEAEADILLVQRVRAGDEQAANELVQVYLSQVFKYARYVLPYSVSKETVEDICQEVFFRFWTKPESWKPEKCRLIAWLLRVAHNLCVDHIRKNARYIDSTDKEGNEVEHIDHSADAVHVMAETDDLKAVVTQALDQLNPDQRSAVSLCYLRGLSNEEAAQIMGLSLSALQSLMARARRKLAKILVNDPRSKAVELQR